jgi:hypothetical protein
MCFSKTVYIITSQFNEKRIHRHRSEQSLAASAKRKQKAIEQATIAALRAATGAGTSGARPTVAATSTKK